MMTIQACSFASMDDFNQTFQFQQQINPPTMMMVMPESSSLVPAPVPLAMVPMLRTLVEKQSQEIGRYLQQQNNLLRINIRQRSKQQLASLIRGLELMADSAIRKKDEELGMVRNRTMQLEECLKKLGQNRDGWEMVARENEALAISLGNTLEQLQNPCFSSIGRAEEEKGEEITSGAAADTVRSGWCRVCGARESCMLLLPCRHVSSCAQCDGSILSCPVCTSAKEASVEVFLA